MDNSKEELIGLKLRQCRKNSGLSQQQVGKALGMDRSTYAYYELGRSQPSIQTLVRLSQIFRIDPLSLLPSEDESHSLSDSKHNSATPIYTLTKDEQSLLISYRLLNTDKKAEFLDKITNMVEKEN